jgi:hypothetical protein
VPLQSKLFKGDRALEACAVNDAAHITPGATGDHVSKVQSALIQLDHLSIVDLETTAKNYGTSTAAAVLAYKRKRSIINRTYQTQPDNIVGKMTIASLDSELLTLESRRVAICTLPDSTRPSVGSRALVGGPPPVSDAARALSWVGSSFALLDRILSFNAGRGPFPQRDFDITDTHFHQRKLNDSNDRRALLQDVRSQFSGIQIVLSRLSEFALHVPISTSTVNFATAPIGGFHRDTTQEKILINDPMFRTCGPNCRAAMLIHESAHYVASAVHFAREGPTLAGEPDCPDAAVKNPDGSCRKHPRNYRDLTPPEAAKNACTYAAFAFHAFSGQDLRPGAFKINF